MEGTRGGLRPRGRPPARGDRRFPARAGRDAYLPRPLRRRAGRRAHHRWLPAVVPPADKATVTFAVTAPDAYQVVANGRLEARVDLPGPTTRTRYRSLRPLPMKVAVIGAARFAVGYPGAAAGVPLESWVYPQSLPSGFDQMAQAGRIVRFFTDKIAPFPFEKLANVESKTRYGGMENAGAIFYSEQAVAEGAGIEPLLAHEIAHQWFGDDVTETSYRRVRALDGVTVRDDCRMTDYRYDEATELLNPFSYQKGAWVLHMLRRRVGDEVFWAGLRRFYRAHAGGSADTRDFRAAMEAASGSDLRSFFEQWTDGPAVPRYEGTWRYEDGRLTVRLRQVAPEDFTYTLPLEIGLYASDGAEPRVETVDVNARRETVSFSVEEAPARVALDPRANALIDVASFERQ
ncbi:MAG: hypothetical protein BRD29_00970 [Bacteroidetes bacterium QH_2_67_10]|nr:MAG: hypothetical protein BRD29_00970 [Bacteroidetes bacterium QH_2_67_10]